MRGVGKLSALLAVPPAQRPHQIAECPLVEVGHAADDEVEFGPPNVQRPEAELAAAKPTAAKDCGSDDEGLFGSLLGGLFGNRKKANQGLVDDLAHQVGKRINTQVTNSIGRAITRGILGAISGKK